MIVLIALLGCTRTPSTTPPAEVSAPLPVTPAGTPFHPPTDDDTGDTGLDCTGAPVRFGSLVLTNGTSPNYIPAISPGKGEICEVTCDYPWMGVTPSSTPSCTDDLGWPAPVLKVSGGISLCFELTGTPTPSTSWSTTCTARHSNGTTTDLVVSW